jgi:hypothetical protein
MSWYSRTMVLQVFHIYERVLLEVSQQRLVQHQHRA